MIDFDKQSHNLSSCSKLFNELGEVFHLCTKENFNILLTNRSDFEAGMNLMGLCAKQVPDVKILTFQLMSNHVHIVLAGNPTTVRHFFDMFLKYLSRYLNSQGRNCLLSWDRLDTKLIPINTLDNLRNVIAYVNRNGFVVNPFVTPFSYEWGANRFYYNPDAKRRFIENREEMKQQHRQEVTHSRKFDRVSGLYLLDGYVSPMGFCHIELAEALYENARQYFYKISKNVENYRDIALEIGERFFYSDEDLYERAKLEARKKHNVTNPSQLPIQAKLEFMRVMHFEYNASNKQISRILNIDISSVNEMFPPR